MRVIGIDPGVSGGWAIMDDGELTDCGRMPTMPRGKRNIADPEVLRSYFLPFTADVAVVEHVNSMPKQGVSSTFAFGMNTGIAEAVAILSAVEMVRVTPGVWKLHYFLKTDKRESLARAAEFWPDWGGWDVLANDGAAEAALMARWWLDMNT